MKSIFLSASIPLPDRDARYYETADVMAIRDAVLALVEVCLTHKINITWGGHPAITPLVYQAINQFKNQDDSTDYHDLDKTIIKKYVTIYQSEYYKDNFPEDNEFFDNIKPIAAGKDKESSEYKMRLEMLKPKQDFIAAVFIGGMEGVQKEYKLFKENYPDLPCFPIASTGAASKMIFEEDCNRYQFSKELLDNYAYKSLFTKIFERLQK